MRTSGTLTSAFIRWRARPPAPMTAMLSDSFAPRTFAAGTAAMKAADLRKTRREGPRTANPPHLFRRDQRERFRNRSLRSRRNATRANGAKIRFECDVIGDVDLGRPAGREDGCLVGI